MNLSVFFFSFSSLIGTGAFLLPFALSQYGWISILFFSITSIMFVYMGYILTKIHPFKILMEYNNQFTIFCINWIYWLISWISTSVILMEIYNYICPFYNINPMLLYIFLISICIFINLFGIKISVRIEKYITIVKFIPLLICIISIIYLPKYNILPIYNNNFNILYSIKKCFIRGVWCYVGIENISIIAPSIKKEYQLDVIFGVILAAILYISILICTYMVLPVIYLQSYMQITALLFKTPIVGSILVILVCIGSLNSWIVGSGYLGYENSKNNIFPSFFSIVNKYSTPYYSIILSSVLLIPIMYISTYYPNFIFTIVDQSSSIILLFYIYLLLLYSIKYKSILSIICAILFSLLLHMSVIYIFIILLIKTILVYIIFKQLNWLR